MILLLFYVSSLLLWYVSMTSWHIFTFLIKMWKMSFHRFWWKCHKNDQNHHFWPFCDHQWPPCGIVQALSRGLRGGWRTPQIWYFDLKWWFWVKIRVCTEPDPSPIPGHPDHDHPVILMKMVILGQKWSFWAKMTSPDRVQDNYHVQALSRGTCTCRLHDLCQNWWKWHKIDDFVSFLTCFWHVADLYTTCTQSWYQPSTMTYVTVYTMSHCQHDGTVILCHFWWKIDENRWKSWFWQVADLSAWSVDPHYYTMVCGWHHPLRMCKNDDFDDFYSISVILTCTKVYGTCHMSHWPWIQGPT